MGGWREVTRMEAGGNGAKESVLQGIFDQWAARRTPVAGVPEWLWALPNPERRTGTKTCSLGYEFTPDAYWPKSQPRIVAEIKYGDKYEPLAIAEAAHHAHLLRQIDRGAPIRPVVISQPNYWIRAAVAELANRRLSHIEADLLTLDDQTLLWLSCPHGKLGAPSSMPRHVPLEQAWTSLRWSAVKDELTWIAHDGKHKPPFLQGPAAMLSQFRNGNRYKWVLWTGQLPTLGRAWRKNDWAKAGSFWVWDVRAKEAPPPPAPRWLFPPV